ncbi:Os02g0310200 [Oryza sativa Japonica Group]|uniref:Os02g0310200 protein n=2 Tax=Oryza sativa subsp. japonica TaxID=39947 RepID=Q0E1S3_ORYSJ|nr:hypothetical protein EE612_010723 [Oryza sativa]KAF2944402.1 hypothetical protein DAI22_02g139201 [Oryza sativa Japonica Group]BAD16233.1 unknown protein [Oryza sativa Japonica Group]BAF08565.1 Os02g0310200 [Oryza sativa Japonica Group]BAS78312.1 Os02g0310200 [Oryza sativa Japonica Group]|eukprot:NP_001046651.1 Os02g0310200 [Oryza sativa Japonica Group]
MASPLSSNRLCALPSAVKAYRLYGEHVLLLILCSHHLPATLARHLWSCFSSCCSSLRFRDSRSSPMRWLQELQKINFAARSSSPIR